MINHCPSGRSHHSRRETIKWLDSKWKPDTCNSTATLTHTLHWPAPPAYLFTQWLTDEITRPITSVPILPTWGRNQIKPLLVYTHWINSSSSTKLNNSLYCLCNTDTTETCTVVKCLWISGGALRNRSDSGTATGSTRQPNHSHFLRAFTSLP